MIIILGLTEISDPGSGIPEEMVLLGNYPNPFNPETLIRYGLSDRAPVVLQIFNSLGQSVRTLVNETQSAGYKAVRWNGKNNFGEPLPTGIPFIMGNRARNKINMPVLR